MKPLALLGLGFVLLLVLGSTVFAEILEAPSAGPLSSITVPSKYHFVDIGWAWTNAEKAVIREALREWDERICDVTTFIEDPTAGFSFDWANEAVFKVWGTDDYTNSLALCVPSGCTSMPGVTKNELYFNVKYSWYVDPDPTDNETFVDFDLLSVAKHEIGHILGLAGDYTDPARGSEVMWYGFAPGERRHQTEQDFTELRNLGYHVSVPEPATLLLLGFGTLGLLKKRRA